jgi:hypothetical protein
MLNCVYHPIDEMRVVEDEEKERLLATGVWFASPVTAREYRERVESELKEEEKLPKRKARGKKGD